MRERTCIVTRQRADEADLIRFVADPQGVLVPDLRAVLPGRGAWVRADAATLAQAVRRGAFARALRLPAPPGGLETLVGRTHTLLRTTALGRLGLARKAGLVLTGFSKVEGALKAGSVHALLHAEGAGADGQGKLDRIAGHLGVPVFRAFTSDEMGLSLGQEHVIHAALLDGPGAARFLEPLARLTAFGPVPAAPGAGASGAGPDA